MPRASSKRKSRPLNSAPAAKSSRVDSSSSASRKALSKVRQLVDSFFESYVNKSLGMIDPEGIEALCSDLQVDHTDVRILMLAWKMKAEKQGYFTQEEWRRGLDALKVDRISKLKKSLSNLEKEVSKPENFDDFYMYAFRYCLTEEKQKCVDIESACVLLDLVLGPKYRSQVEYFTKYLKSQKEYKVINKDQWLNFLRFCQEISFPDLENYDSDQAWSLILDNFVEWMKSKAS
ncbi:DCN1-like protein 4 [Coffea eugenioides]|uniref:DCN1-like protein 4 n=1 Tax=Coffea eugenioides TaxID=49369 RepID=UPI000F614307|nr:DCN1-like protein 4 [Coffea eugenioides]